MSDRLEGGSEGEAERNDGAHEPEIDEALVRDAELDADPTSAISLKQLDEWFRRRQSRSVRD